MKSGDAKVEAEMILAFLPWGLTWAEQLWNCLVHGIGAQTIVFSLIIFLVVESSGCRNQISGLHQIVFNFYTVLFVTCMV